MAALKDRLRGDLTAAMKARDEVRTRTLRMALTAVAQAEVAGPAARVHGDEAVSAGHTRAAPRRREAAEASAYLPAQLTDAEIAGLVAEVISETGAAGPAAMGQVMKALAPRVAGRADGARVAVQVRRALAG